MKKVRPTIKQRIGWYPVSSIGWTVSIGYCLLLLYVVVAINRDLYNTNISLFYGSVIISGIITLILLYAKVTNEQPFCKK